MKTSKTNGFDVPLPKANSIELSDLRYCMVTVSKDLNKKELEQMAYKIKKHLLLTYSVICNTEIKEV